MVIKNVIEKQNIKERITKFTGYFTGFIIWNLPK